MQNLLPRVIVTASASINWPFAIVKIIVIIIAIEIIRRALSEFDNRQRRVRPHVQMDDPLWVYICLGTIGYVVLFIMLILWYTLSLLVERAVGGIRLNG